MSKTVQIDDAQAQRLERLARRAGVSESELIAQALDALFPLEALPARTREEAELLQRLEEEYGPLPPYVVGTSLDPADVVSFVGTPIRSE